MLWKTFHAAMAQRVKIAGQRSLSDRTKSGGQP
jgi:hypothetical protein